MHPMSMCPRLPEEGISSPGSGIRGDHEPSNVGAGSLIWALCKGRVYRHGETPGSKVTGEQMITSFSTPSHTASWREVGVGTRRPALGQRLWREGDAYWPATH